MAAGALGLLAVAWLVYTVALILITILGDPYAAAVGWLIWLLPIGLVLWCSVKANTDDDY